MPSVIIIDKMHPSIIPQLESLGYQVDYCPEITRAQVIDEIHRYCGLVVRSKTYIDNDLLANAVKLRFVARAGAGLDNLDEQAIKQHGIHILNAPEGNRDALGEHVVGMLLNLLHGISGANQSMKWGKWDREAFRGTELGSKTVGVIGCGNMGNAFVQRLKGFNCTILGYDKYLHHPQSSAYQPASLEELFDRCDIVSLHVPLTGETRGFYNYSFFEQFKKPIILLNSARGEILPLDDLVRLLQEKKITAAALDVFEYEPFVQVSDSQNDTYQYLVAHPQVLVTPHVAGWSHESYTRINDVLIRKIKALKAAGTLD